MDTMLHLISTLNTAQRGQRQPQITKAFITEAVFSVGDAAYPAVVTGGYIDRQRGTFEINFDALGYSGQAPISLTIDDHDLRAVREHLGIGRDNRRRLDMAVSTLKRIAAESMDDPSATWQDLAMMCIALARNTLDDMNDEADNAQSDS